MTQDSRWNGYRRIIESEGGFIKTKVYELLTVLGKQRAGAQVVKDLERELVAHGIGHLPSRIPRNQRAQVLVYDQAGGLGSILHMTQQLASDQAPAGTEADPQVVGLSMLIDAHRKTLEGARRIVEERKAKHGE